MNLLCPNCRAQVKDRRANPKCTNCGAILVQVREEWRVHSLPGIMKNVDNMLFALIVVLLIWSVYSKSHLAFILTSAAVSVGCVFRFAEGLLTGKVRSMMWLITAEDGWLYYSELCIYALGSIVGIATFVRLLRIMHST